MNGIDVLKNKYGFEYFCDNNKTVITIPCGVHYIDEPIEIDSSNIQICGKDGAVLRASTPIKNEWHKYKDNIFYTDVDKNVDALYVNGKKYTMARFPKYDSSVEMFGGYSKLATSRKMAKKWKNPQGAYIHAMHTRLWGGFSYKIIGKDVFNNLRYEGGWQNNRQMGMHKDYRFVENVFEEMTLAGEWYFDEIKKRVYCIPFQKDDLMSAEIVINSSFFKFKNCENITLSNVIFEHSSRTFMMTKEPLLRSDWTIYRGGAVYFSNCKNTTLTKCKFKDIGSNGVFVDGKNQNINITKTHFKNIGASAVCFVGGSDSVRNPLFEYEQTQNVKNIDLEKGPKSENYPRECTVEDCLIEKVGVTEKQATGVEISMAYKISVINTSIYNTSRAGINISEGTFGGHVIDGCDVFDTVKETGDHGSFNSWGRDRFWNLKGVKSEDVYKYAFLDCIEPNIIRNNRFRCDKGWDIDLDDGSTNYEICNNLCLNGGIKLREGFSRFVHHNITVNNSIHVHCWYPNSEDRVQNNILFQSYKPALMNVKWGKNFDNNILHKSGIDNPIKAECLSSLSKMDDNSFCIDCKFKDPSSCDYTVNSEYVNGFEQFPTKFGVRYEPLRKIAKEPVFPTFDCLKKNENQTNLTEIFEMKVKNVETDGEMSVYGTAGHKGVIVVNVNGKSIASKKGLNVNDVIIKVGKREINCSDDLLKISILSFTLNKITVLRYQVKTVL